MNPIFQDRDITAGALSRARIGAQSHARANMCRAFESARISQHPWDGTRNSTQEQVGKKMGGSWQNFAIWFQLANGCQLNCFTNQQLSDFPDQLAVGRWQKLPTALSPCFYSLSTPSEVGENSPLPTGEVNTPTMCRGCLPRCCPHGNGPRPEVGGVQ